MAAGPLDRRRFPSRSPFDQIRHIDVDSDGSDIEYWSAREAMEFLGYARWENLENVIRKAKAACRNTGHEVGDHFRDVTKMIDIGKGGRRMGTDIQMDRFGMYLLAMNGDPDKSEIAAAQRYFAIQTYRAEQALPQPQPQPATPLQPADSPRLWAERFRRTFLPHVAELHQRHPGCFSVVSAVVSEIIFIEYEILRHLMTTRAFDRPDVSIGLRWAADRRARGLPDATRSTRLYLPDQRIDVDVNVYDGGEWPMFAMWFRNRYLSEHLGYYLDHKKELRVYKQLTRSSVADNSCRKLSGRPAVLTPGIRAALTAAGGFVPARPALPGR